MSQLQLSNRDSWSWGIRNMEWVIYSSQHFTQKTLNSFKKTILWSTLFCPVHYFQKGTRNFQKYLKIGWAKRQKNRVNSCFQCRCCLYTLVALMIWASLYQGLVKPSIRILNKTLVFMLHWKPYGGVIGY